MSDTAQDIRVELGNGDVLSFPPGTDDAVIDRVAKKHAFQAKFPGADVSPIKFDEASETKSVGIFPWDADRNQLPAFKEGHDKKLAELARRKSLAELGVDYRASDDLISAARAQAAWGMDPRAALQTTLNQKFGKDTPIQEFDGELYFLNPKTRRIQPINPMGADLGDVGEIAAGAPQFVGDVVGSAVGAAVGAVAGGAAGGPIGVAPGAILGEIPGSLAGQTGGDFIRLLIGDAMGVNPEEVSFTQMDEKASDNVLTTENILMTALMPLGVGAAQGVRKFIANKGMITAEYLQALGVADDVSKDIADRVNSILKETGSDAHFSPTLGQRLDDPIIQDFEKKTRDMRDQVAELQARDFNNQQALVAALDARTPQVDDLTQGSKRVIAEAGGMVSQEKAIAERGVTDAVGRAKARIQSIRSADLPGTSRDVATRLTELRAARKEEVDALASKWRETAGYNPETGRTNIQIPLSDEGKRIIKEANALRGESPLSNPSVPANGGIKPPYEDLIDEEASLALGIPVIISHGKKTYDLNAVQRELSALKQKVKVAAQGTDINGNLVKTYNDQIKILKDSRDRFLEANHPELSKQINDMEIARRKLGDEFDRSIVGEILDSDRQSKTLHTLFKPIAEGGVDIADEVLMAAGNDPLIMDGMRSGIKTLYKKAVMGNDGVPDAIAHKKFMDDYGPVLKRYVDASTFKNMQRNGGVFAEIAKAEALRDKELSRIAKTFGADIASTKEPAKLLGYLLDSTDKAPDVAVERMRQLKRMGLSDSTMELLGSEARKRFQLNVLGTPQVYNSQEVRFIDPTKMKNALKNQGAALSELVGREYVRDLTAISEGLIMLGKEGGRSLDNTTMVSRVAEGLYRAGFAPPLSARGRFTTAVKDALHGTNTYKMAELIKNPEAVKDLRKAAELLAVGSKRQTANRVAIDLLAKYGIDINEEEPANNGN